MSGKIDLNASIDRRTENDAGNTVLPPISKCGAMMIKFYLKNDFPSNI